MSNAEQLEASFAEAVKVIVEMRMAIIDMLGVNKSTEELIKKCNTAAASARKAEALLLKWEGEK